MIYKTQKNKLKLSKQEYLALRDLSRKAKDFYNVCMYEIRQYYFANKQYLNRFELYHIVKNHPDYKLLPTDVSSCIMTVVDQNWKSFFALLKQKLAGKYSEKVHTPRYLEKDGFFNIVYPRRKAQKRQTEIEIRFPKWIQDKHKIKKLSITIPKNILGNDLQIINIAPKYKAKWFDINFVYKTEIKKENLHNEKSMSIDMGVSNFATCLDISGLSSFILDGREMKSINRYFNKTIAKLQSLLKNQKTSIRIQRLLVRRKNQLNEYLRHYVKYVIDYCIKNNIGTLFIGDGTNIKNINIGDKNNQNYMHLPKAEFVNLLKYKFESIGGIVKIVDESYTSKCDHLAGEPMQHHDTYLGKRIKRGLFLSCTGKLINADVNGALGIYLKGIGKHISDVRLSSGVVSTPCRIRLNNIKICSTQAKVC